MYSQNPDLAWHLILPSYYHNKIIKMARSYISAHSFNILYVRRTATCMYRRVKAYVHTKMFPIVTLIYVIY